MKPFTRLLLYSLTSRTSSFLLPLPTPSFPSISSATTPCLFSLSLLPTSHLSFFLSSLPFSIPSHFQHPFATADCQLGEILHQLVQRTMEAVHMLDHQNYRRLQKLLMRESEKMENDTTAEGNEIESEPPRCVRGNTSFGESLDLE